MANTEDRQGNSPGALPPDQVSTVSEYVPGPGEPALQFGPYRILGRLGKGGMGAVYLAEDVRLDRRVAVKIPFRSGRNEEKVIHRFRNEAQALARLHHPNLCTVYEVDQHDGLHYLTMRYIEGHSLRKCLDRYRDRRAAALVATLARAMAACHAEGVIHRDLKPENILLDRRDQPVVVDFGLALACDDRQTRLTQVGDVPGTTAYMAPEQQAGDVEAIGPGCDVYSLGVILYELLAGKRPFQGLFLAILTAKEREQYTSLREFGIDSDLEAICQQALRKEIGARFRSMTEFADRLDAYLEDRLSTSPSAPVTLPTVVAQTTTHPSDPREVEAALQLLRDWGWEEGLKRLDERLVAIPEAHRRGVLRLLSGWIKGQQGAHAAGIEHFRQAEQVPELKAWAQVGQAFIGYREQQYDRAWDLLTQAEAGSVLDPVLQASIDHGRGAICYRQARDDEALTYLFRAAERFGPNHYMFGRVLDTLGMVYKTRDDFPTACTLFQKALEAKQGHADLLGQALTHGQLGRLLLDWGELDRAEKEFRLDLAFCQQTNDSRGEAQMYNHLGQVLLARGQADRALAYLHESVARNQVGGWGPNEAYARKDRARALLALGRRAEAEQDAREAERLAADQTEIAFHARRVLALVLAAQGQVQETEPLLRRAAAFFRDRKEPAEAARALLALARVQLGTPGALARATESLRAGLAAADRSRRDRLVGEIEQELATVDREELYRRGYLRARGAAVPEDVGSFRGVRCEKATILSLELRNVTGPGQLQDPSLAQAALNQTFAELDVTAERHDIVIHQYRGDGFLAVARDQDHARRAVAGALGMQAVVAALNRPRRLLGYPLLEARIGVGTGEVVFGNVGTYRKVDFTAVGPTLNRTLRLPGEAPAGGVCVDEETFQRVREGFAFAPEGGRLVALPGIGAVRVWEVSGLKRL